MAPRLLVGQRVLSRAEPDLDLEKATIKSFVDCEQDDAVTYTLRFESGFLRPNVPRDEIVPDLSPPEPEFVKDSFPDDAEYDAQVRPLLPDAPTNPDGDAPKANLFAFANAYKAVGNSLFKESKLSWAVRTYLACVQLLQRLGFSTDPESMIYDVDAQAVCIACFSNAALCALKLEEHARAVLITMHD